MTSVVEQQPSPENVVVRQQPMEIHHPSITPSEETNPIIPTTSAATSTPAVPVKINRFSVAPCQLNEPVIGENNSTATNNPHKYATIVDFNVKTDEPDSTTTADAMTTSVIERTGRFSVTHSQLNGFTPESAPATIHLGDLQV